MLTGKDLPGMGFKAGKWFKEALTHINAHGLAGEPMLVAPAEVQLGQRVARRGGRRGNGKNQ